MQNDHEISTPSDEETTSLAANVIHKALSRDYSLGTAESCTGGLVSGALTAVPGSSAVVLGGVTSYALSVKQAVLGVLQETLDGPGAVSSDCARQMAEGACRVLGCNIAVSTTGIAGPGGAEPGKPVGTVWFGICSHGSTQTEVCLFEGDRSSVRKQAVLHALQLLLQALENE